MAKPSRDEKRSERSASAKPKRLGKGLAGLMGSPVAVELPTPVDDSPASAVNTTDSGDRTSTSADGTSPKQVDPATDRLRAIFISIDTVAANPRQPRRVFDDGSLSDLAASIRRSGVIQPVLVRERPDGEGRARYELIAGERRWRAARLAGLSEIPAVVTDASDAESAERAIVENVQREDLRPMERGEAFASLASTFGLTHAQVAERVGLSRASVTNQIRLLELEPEVRELVDRGALSMGHARALLAAPSGPARIGLATRAVRDGLSVRRVEAEAARADAPGPMAQGAADVKRNERSAAVEDLERQLSEKLGTGVTITTDSTGRKGRIIVRFYDLDHFEGLLTRLGVSLDD